MTDTPTQEVLTSVEDGVLIVTINRPEAKNAMTRAAAEAIAAAMDRLDSEDDLRVGILTGAGGTFCSGMDLKGFLRGERPSVEGRGFGGVVEAPPAKPLIAGEKQEIEVSVMTSPMKEFSQVSVNALWTWLATIHASSRLVTPALMMSVRGRRLRPR